MASQGSLPGVATVELLAFAVRVSVSAGRHDVTPSSSNTPRHGCKAQEQRLHSAACQSWPFCALSPKALYSLRLCAAYLEGERQ